MKGKHDYGIAFEYFDGIEWLFVRDMVWEDDGTISISVMLPDGKLQKIYDADVTSFRR